MAFVVAATWRAKPGEADRQAYEDHKNSEHFQKHVFGYAIDYLAERSVKTYQTIDV
jgi:quinol monooxygenase YgiN